jgi:hypothetical protein
MLVGTAQIDRIQRSLLLLVAAKKAGLTAAAHKVLFGGYIWVVVGKDGQMRLI